MLKFIALSGTISVTENLYVYEYGDSMVVVDCGVGFPDLEMHGVDLVIPDFSYIVKNQNKLKGIVISHAHEDHIGAVPYLFKNLRTSIWCAPLVTAFLQDKFKESGIKGAKINTFNPDNDSFDVGPFKFHPFRVTHSVPDSCGFAIDTPVGRVFHVSDNKMDQNPIDGMPFDKKRASELAQKKSLFLASDCLGSNKPGLAKGERQIEGNVFNIAQKAGQGAVIFTAISSNIGRFQQAINVAQKLKRKVVFVGRSVQRKTEIAHNLGYLRYHKNLVVPLKRARSLPRNKLLYIIAGCYGQIGSSLYRIAINDHDRVKVQRGDMVIFSADPAPPYSKESENFVIDNLIDKGADVHYYDLNEEIYVTGHGRQDDIIELFKIVKPKYFIPIGGAIRFMHAYEKLVVKYGARSKNVFKLKPGDVVEFENGNAKRGKTISVKEVLVDGLGIGDVGRVVLEDRKTLGSHGVAVVIVKVNKSGKGLIQNPEIISRGFVFQKQEKKFLQDSAVALRQKLEASGKLDKSSANKLCVDFLSNLFYKETARKPMIVPVVVEGLDK